MCVCGGGVGCPLEATRFMHFSCMCTLKSGSPDPNSSTLTTLDSDLLSLSFSFLNSVMGIPHRNIVMINFKRLLQRTYQIVHGM